MVAALSSAGESLTVGEFSKPFFANVAWHVIFLGEKVRAHSESFEEMRPVIEAEFRRRSADAILGQGNLVSQSLTSFRRSRI